MKTFFCKKQFIYLMGVSFIIFLGYIIYSANNGTIPSFIRQIYMFPGGDKVGHVVLLAILSFFVNYFLYPRSFQIFGKTVFMGSFLVFGFITFEELSQIYIPNRSFDLLDLLCSYIGIVLGASLVKYMKIKINFDDCK